jgi:hypothetical protein
MKIRSRMHLVAIVFVTAMVFAFQGCGDSVAPSDGKSEARATHLARLQLYLDADAVGYAASFYPGAVDLGGGSTGTGALPAEFFTAGFWQAVFQGAQFQAQFAGKSMAEVVNEASTRVLSKTEAEGEFGPDLGFQGTSFRMQADDLVAYTEPTQNSPLVDGWFGVYRRIEGSWLVVGVD